MERGELQDETYYSVPYVRSDYTDRHDVARRDILRMSLHSGLYFANGKVPCAPITSFRWRWPDWIELQQQQPRSPSLSRYSSSLCRPTQCILVVINTSASSKRGEPAGGVRVGDLALRFYEKERENACRRSLPPSGNSRQRSSARGSTADTPEMKIVNQGEKLNM